jgi:hypothetical protein
MGRRDATHRLIALATMGNHQIPPFSAEPVQRRSSRIGLPGFDPYRANEMFRRLKARPLRPRSARLIETALAFWTEQHHQNALAAQSVAPDSRTTGAQRCHCARMNSVN